MTITFRQRWREELEAISEEGVLVFEMTIAGFHVYFPTQNRWEAQVPPWAKPRWEEYKSACEAWCKQQRVPITFVDDANVTFEKHAK